MRYVLDLTGTGQDPFLTEQRGRLPQDGRRRRMENGNPVVDRESFQRLHQICAVCAEKGTVPRWNGLTVEMVNPTGDGVVLEVRHPELSTPFRIGDEKPSVALETSAESNLLST